MIRQELYIGDTENKGRGMFTHAACPAGTVMEIAPVIVMSSEERLLLDKTTLHDYIFEWNPGDRQMCCMALGYIAVYNHSYASNCEHFMDYEQQTISVKTVRDIEAGEELTINYNGDWNSREPVWFEVND